MAGTTAPKRKTLKTRGRKQKDQQQFIPGTEPVRIKSIDTVAERYVEARDQRMSIGEEEVELKDKLIKAMKAEGLTEYAFDGYMVELSHIDEDQVKVKKIRAAKSDGALA